MKTTTKTTKKSRQRHDVVEALNAPGSRNRRNRHAFSQTTYAPRGRDRTGTGGPDRRHRGHRCRSRERCQPPIRPTTGSPPLNHGVREGSDDGGRSCGMTAAAPRVMLSATDAYRESDLPAGGGSALAGDGSFRYRAARMLLLGAPGFGRGRGYPACRSARGFALFAARFCTTTVLYWFPVTVTKSRGLECERQRARLQSEPGMTRLTREPSRRLAR